MGMDVAIFIFVIFIFISERCSVRYTSWFNSCHSLQNVNYLHLETSLITWLVSALFDLSREQAKDGKNSTNWTKIRWLNLAIFCQHFSISASFINLSQVMQCLKKSYVITWFNLHHHKLWQWNFLSILLSFLGEVLNWEKGVFWLATYFSLEGLAYFRW